MNVANILTPTTHTTYYQLYYARYLALGKLTDSKSKHGVLKATDHQFSTADSLTKETIYMDMMAKNM